MNKRELIERINNTLFDNLKDTLFTEPTLSITENTKDNKVAITFETEQGGALVSGMLKKFEKVTIPQFVADWIEKCKSEKRRLHESLTYTPVGVNGWVSNPKNQETFARAWLDGYEVEKEKRYLVKLKDEVSESFFIYGLVSQKYFFSSDSRESKCRRVTHTRKELEKAGFGDVFTSTLFEVEEVEE